MPNYLARHHARARALIIAASFVFTLAACGRTATPASSTDAGAADAVRAVSAAWDEAHNAANLEALIQLYSESAVSMPYSRPALEGLPAIEADFREFFAGYNARHETTIVSLEVVSNWAIERGTYKLTAAGKQGGPATSELGKHVVIRKKEDGAWKIQWEIWNTDAAPAP